LEQLNKGEDAILDWWRLLYENGYPLEEYHTTERMAYNQEFLMNSCMFLDQEFPGNDITDSVIEKVKLGMKEHRAGNYSFLQEDYMEDYMMLKYPVLLVHGAGFRDKTLGFVNYWGRIPKSFAKNGVTVYYGGTDAWGSIEGNAEIIKNSIEAILAETNAEKVNIIAHSRGGLESRYLISTLNMGHAVASLTTISTPHHGVKAMNIAMELPVGLYKFCSFFVNTWFRILGDKKPNFFESSRQLSEKCSIAFNENNPDKEGIYYQSYAGMMQYFFSDLTFIAMHPFIFFADGANDGLCPVESAKWGDFKGIITTEGAFGISHCGVIDLYRVNYKGLNILDFYLSIAQGLSEKGL
jgi:triacylglycerol lipase